jgi:dTDP-4-dehydrorhamnose reductase
MAPLKILVTGKNGQLGWELLRTLATLGEVTGVDVDTLDLTDQAKVAALVRELRPDLIVHPAAFTAVDAAEKQPELAQKVNGEAPGLLAALAKEAGALFVGYSTDYVFDGGKAGFTEEDTPNPLNVYGRTKLAGDRAIAASDASYLIFRVSWLYGARGKNYLLTMLRLLRNGTPLRIVNDQIGAPTWARSVAEATAQAVARIQSVAGGGSLAEKARQYRGVYNLTCAGSVSWHGFTQAIATGAMQRGLLASVPEIPGIPTSEYKTDAVRPLNSLLDNAKVQKTFAIHMPEWQTALNLVLDEVAEKQVPC